MEYEKRIKELLDAVSTLLESNNELGGRLSASLEKIEALEAENARLRGELAQRKRSRYGKSSEKSHGGPSNKGKTKEEQEEDYIRNGSKKGVPVEETDEEDVYLSFIETCKLRKKGVLDFFREFFGMAASGRTDYEAMSEALLC